MPRFSGAGYAPVAQLDRVSDSDSEGRWFESSRAYQKERHDENRVFLFVFVSTGHNIVLQRSCKHHLSEG